jgi:hypothetical protein
VITSSLFLRPRALSLLLPEEYRLFSVRGSTVNVLSYERILPELWVHEKDIRFILELVEFLG